MIYKLLSNGNEIGSFKEAEMIELKIKEICENISHYKSHHSRPFLFDMNEVKASYLIHTMVILQDDTLRTMSYSLLIDKSKQKIRWI